MTPSHHFLSRFQAKILTNSLRYLRKHPKPPSKKSPNNTSTFPKTDCLSENSFFKSRPRMAPQADPQSGKCSYIDPLSFIVSSKTGLSRPQTDFYLMFLISTPVFHDFFFHLEASGMYFLKNIYSLLRRVRHNSKI